MHETPPSGAGIGACAPPLTVRTLLATAGARYGPRPAVTSAGATWTYEELFTRAEALRARLVLAGAGPGTLVALHLQRGPHVLAGMIAILLAGAGYVALDPAYPRARLRLMADDAGPVVALGTAESAILFGDHVPVVQPDAAASGGTTAGGTGAGAVTPAPRPDDTCYVFFTSGSTGRPKGIPASHANVVAFLDAMDAAVMPADAGGGPGRWLGLTSASFDPSVVELLWTTTRGHHVVLPPPGATLALVADGTLAATLEQHHVTHLQCTPTVLQLLLADPPHRRALGSVRQLLVGGEALPRAVADDATRVIGGQLTNLYGPTETTVWAFAHHVAAGEKGPVPIGRPLPGVLARVLADDGTEAPTGTPGELLIGGPGVAAGYLDRPDLTAERFLVTGHDHGSATRFYRTGDLVEASADGTFAFLGRGDDQVKVQGNRVEPGDVEAAAASFPGVGRAVAFVIGESLDAQLALAVVALQGVVVDADALRRHLTGHLPPGMVPARIVVVDEVPATPSGKTDRRALARSFSAGAGVDIDGVRALIAATLGLPSVGEDDDFFDRGGDSLAAIELMARVHERYGLLLGLSTLVQAPTPAQLAVRLAQHRAASPGEAERWRSVVPLAEGAGTPFFCVHGIGGNVLNLVPLARAMPGGTAFYGIQAAGVDGRQHPDTTMAAMVGRYADDIRAVQPHGPYTLGGYSDGGIVALELARALEAAGERVATVVLFDADPPAPGGRTLARRLDNLRANVRVRGARAMVAAVARAGARRVSPARRAAERRLGYRITTHARHVDLARALHDVLGRHDPAPSTVPVLHVRAARFRPCDAPEARWDPLLHGPVERTVVPGDHLTMFSARHADAVATALATHLAGLSSTAGTTPLPEPVP